MKTPRRRNSLATAAFEALEGRLLLAADLTVQAAADTYQSLPGAEVNVDVTTGNIGDAAAEADADPGVEPWTVSLWLSDDAAFDPGTDTHVGHYEVVTLGAGADTADTVTFNAPAAPGSYTLFGFADSDAEVTEDSDANNTAVVGTLLVGIDLTVQPAADSYQAAAGANVDVDITVLNNGFAQAVTDTNPGVDTWVVSLWVSDDPYFDLFLDGNFGAYAVTTLAGGAQTTQAVSFNAPAPGEYTLFGFADSGGRVTEDNDANNVTLIGNLSVGPDLVIEAAADLYAAEGGQPVDVPVQVNNVGFAAAEDDTDPGVDPWTVSLWLSTDGAFDPLVDTQVGSYTVTTLAAGAEVSQVISFNAPAGAQGYTLFGVADEPGGVTEYSEANNVSVVGALSVGPDLVIEAAAAVYQAAAGQQVNVPVQVNNVGAAVAEDDADPGVDAWTVTLWLSTDAVFDPGTDTQVGSYDVTTLAGGAEVSQVVSFNAPAGTQGYTLFGVADSGGQVAEFDEDNNASVLGTLGVGADLTVEIDDGTVTGDEAVPGDVSWVAVEVANAGTAAASGRATVQLYASADGVVGAGDYLLGQRTVRIYLQPGRAATYWLRTRVPANIPAGNYNVLAVVDSGNAIAEADETNNTDAAANQAAIVWKFGAFDANHRGPRQTLVDLNGNRVTFWLAGGWGEVTQGANGFRVTLYETTASQRLWIMTPKGVTTRVERLIVVDDPGLDWDGSIRWLRARSTDFVDDGAGTSLISVPGTVRWIWFNRVVEGEIQVGDPLWASDSFSLWLTSVMDLVVTSDTPIYQLFVWQGWADTDAVFDQVTAPSIRHFWTAGNVIGMNLALAGNPVAGGYTLNRAYIGGDLVDAFWDVGGSGGLIQVRGTVNAADMAFAADVRRLYVGAMDNSSVELATADPLDTHATLYHMRVGGVGGNYFINDSFVGAWTIWRLRFAAPSVGFGTIVYHTAGRIVSTPTGVDVFTV